MSYRAVADARGVVIAVATDTGQSGPYAGGGTWQDFTFEAFPAIPADVATAMKSSIHHPPMAFKVAQLKALARALSEINADAGVK